MMEHSTFGKQFTLSSYKHNMFYSNGFEGIVKNEELHSETFIIQFTKEAFIRLTRDASEKMKRFGDKILEGKPVALSENNLFIDIMMHNAIREIVNCKYQDGLKKMFMLSKCIEILVLQAEAFSRAENAQQLYCKTDYDKERILFARE